jgi:UDP-N-acetylglucosamine acyltransferase
MIDPQAIVHPDAKVAPGVSIGPFSIVGARVEIGEDTRIGAHVVLEGRTRVGRRNNIYHHASVGGPPQDKKYGGEDTALDIGDGNTIREYVTINCGTVQDAGVTRIGDDNWIMAYVHIAHDCQIANHTILANLVQLGGHVRVDDWAILGGGVLVHQYVHIGAHSFLGMQTAIGSDVPPYVKISGSPPRPFGLNSEGLRRRGFAADSIQTIKRAYRTLYRSGLSLEDATRELVTQAESHAEVRVMAEFLARATRGIVR